MAAILSTDELTAALRGAVAFQKQMPVMTTSNWGSCWATTGYPAGVAPGAVTLCSAATPGAVPLPALSAGQDLYLTSLDMVAAQGGTLLLIDRLAHNGNLNGTLITAQAINTPALDARYPSQVGNLLGVEVYSALGATATTATISYTNQAGVAGRTATVAIGANLPAGRFLPVTLAVGDTGVRSVESLTLAASTGTAGAFGITLYRQVAQIGVPNIGIGASKSFVDLGLPDIGSGSTSTACLGLIFIPNTTAQALICCSAGLAVK